MSGLLRLVTGNVASNNPKDDCQKRQNDKDHVHHKAGLLVWRTGHMDGFNYDNDNQNGEENASNETEKLLPHRTHTQHYTGKRQSQRRPFAGWLRLKNFKRRHHPNRGHRFQLQDLGANSRQACLGLHLGEGFRHRQAQPHARA